MIFPKSGIQPRSKSGPGFSGSCVFAALIVDHFGGLVLQPVLGSFGRQRVDAVEPRGLALDAILLGRRHGFGIVETVDGDADAPGAVERIGERRAAVLAEAALRKVGAPEDRRRAARPCEVLALAAGEAHHGLPGRLLAHAAKAHAGIGRLHGPFVAHRTALAAAGEIFRHSPSSCFTSAINFFAWRALNSSFDMNDLASILSV